MRDTACNCSGHHGGPHHSAYVERVAEANLDDDHQAASFVRHRPHATACSAGADGSG
jgi:hypothetical protein